MADSDAREKRKEELEAKVSNHCPSHPPLISVGKLFQRRKVEEMRARRAAKNNIVS